ncbi:MAG: HNH endonuclease signature motif containing protein [Ilumatobacteraceae bacterium]
MVEDRDRICRHPACTSTSHLEVHHILHWVRGGSTDTANLVCLCGRHHRAHHRGDFTIAGDADVGDGLTFCDATGRIIAGSGTPPPPGGHPPPDPAQPYVHPTGERLELRWLSFLPPPQEHDTN